MRRQILQILAITSLLVRVGDTLAGTPELATQFANLDSLKLQEYATQRDRLLAIPSAKETLKSLVQKQNDSVLMKAVYARSVHTAEAGRFDSWIHDYCHAQNEAAEPVIIKGIYSRPKKDREQYDPMRFVRASWLLNFDLNAGWQSWSQRVAKAEAILPSVLHDPVGIHASARPHVAHRLCMSKWRKEIGPIADLWFIEACMKYPDLLDVERYLFMTSVLRANLQKGGNPVADQQRLTNADVLSLAENLSSSEDLWARLAGMTALYSSSGKGPLDTVLARLEDKCVAVRALALGSLKHYVKGDDEKKVSENRQKISEAMTRRYAQEDIESFRQIMEAETRKLFEKQEAEATIEKMHKARKNKPAVSKNQ